MFLLRIALSQDDDISDDFVYQWSLLEWNGADYIHRTNVPSFLSPLIRFDFVRMNTLLRRYLADVVCL